MTSLQKAIKYCAIAFAVFLTVSIIGGIVSAVAGASLIFGDHDAVGDMQTYAVREDIDTLDIDIVAAELIIETGDAFSVESNLEQITVSDRDGCLRIEEKSRRLGATRHDALLKLTLPVGCTFRKADIVTGAGRVTVDALAAEMLELEFGAGEVRIDRLTATRQADIDGGAGKITVADGALAGLDLDMGVGALELTAALVGRSELDCGVGETAITLIGASADYTVRLEKGIGDATVDGVPAVSGRTYGTGENTLEIGGGIGAIRVDFTQK